MYASVDDLRVYLEQLASDVSEPGNDEALTDVLTRATAIINSAIAAGLGKQSFAFADYGAATTKIVNGYGGEYLTLPPHEIGSVTLVEYLSSVSPNVYTELDADYWTEEEDGRLWYPNGQMHGWFGVMRYRVTAIWGYGPAPADIEQTCLEIAVNIWRSKDAGGFTTVVGVEGGGSYQRFVGGLTKQQQMVIDNFCDRYREIAI